MRKYCNQITIFFLLNTIKTTTLFRQKETTHKTWVVFYSIIGKFSLLRVHGHFTKKPLQLPWCYSRFNCMLCHLRFLCDIVTMSSISYLTCCLVCNFKVRDRKESFSFFAGKLEIITSYSLLSFSIIENDRFILIVNFYWYWIYNVNAVCCWNCFV